MPEVNPQDQERRSSPEHPWSQTRMKLTQSYRATPVPTAQRIVECIVSGLALVLTLPVMLLLGVIIRLDSPGPAIFRQDRVGCGGRLFKFTKFRTLYVDAAERFPALYAYDYSDDELQALVFKTSADPRVTRVGGWLRRTSLDELPNLWHVLTGEMALVGPRPEIPQMLPYYSAAGLVRFSVRPGIVGLAEVSGRARLSFRETEQLDIEYVERRSLRLDLQILARTLLAVVRADGAF